MAFRNAQVFVRSSTVRLLRLATKIYPERTDTPVSGQSYDVQSIQTVDERADNLLLRAIEEQYPLVIELAKKQEALEKEFLQKAKNGQ